MKFPSMEEALAEAERTLAIHKEKSDLEAPERFFKTYRGKLVLHHTTRYFCDHLKTWEDVQAHIAGKQLSGFGIGIETASKELKPLIPDAHLWYNEVNNSVRKFKTWEEWAGTFLRNRWQHWFYGKEAGVKGGTRRVAEWPGRLQPYGPMPVPDPGDGIGNDDGKRDCHRNFPLWMKEDRFRDCGGCCEICDEAVTMETCHADHITPWIDGGRTVYNNLQILCVTCNLKKGSMHPNDARKKLKKSK